MAAMTLQEWVASQEKEEAHHLAQIMWEYPKPATSWEELMRLVYAEHRSAVEWYKEHLGMAKEILKYYRR